MIPKIIHYCWFGHNPKPKLAKKCIKSWKRKCRGYKIIEWNEDNFDLSECPLYVRQAYEAGKWAFVTDYVRLKVVYDHGGVYLDTDVELIKNIDYLLINHAYFGFEDGEHIATGLGFGAERNAQILKELLDDYNGIPFIKADGAYDTTPCPKRNTLVFLRHGLIQDNSKQLLDDNILILPNEYLCPISYKTFEKKITSNTVSIHWFSASWQTAEQRINHENKLAQERKDRIIHLPNRIAISVLGERNYSKLKRVFKN